MKRSNAIRVLVFVLSISCLFLSSCHKESGKSKEEKEESELLEKCESVDSQISSLLYIDEETENDANDELQSIIANDDSSSETNTNYSELVSDKLYNMATYEVVSVETDSCVVIVKAPNVKKMIKEMMGDSKYTSMEIIMKEILSRLESDQYEELNVELELPINDGQVSFTQEFIDAMSGELFSLTDEFVES